MSFWWVNHKKTFRDEIDGGFIWSPQRNRNGARNETYLNLTRTQPGDVVFSYAGGELRGVGVVESTFLESPRPAVFGTTGEQWDQVGWRVPINWSLFDRPIAPKSHIAQIAPLLPKVNSPIRADGNGNESCYLAAIDDDLGKLLLRLANETNPTIDALDSIRASIAEAEEEQRIKDAPIPETEKEQLIKARRGQGIFRVRLARIESACRVTGIRDRRFLLASHIKPWRLSSNAEKLDGNNGLLLSPHVDYLFDNGWISFADDGILLRHESVQNVMKTWAIAESRNVGSFNLNQRAYLAFHRERIFRK